MLTSDKVRSVSAEQIATLTPTERLQLLRLLADAVSREASLAIEPPKHEITELHGLGKEIWEGINAREFVNRLRGDWDDQP